MLNSMIATAGKFAGCCILGLGLLASCQSPQGQNPRRAAGDSAGVISELSPPGSADQAVGSDPCAARLHDIAGAMLFYFALNKHLPASLSDLQALSDFDNPLVFACPHSQQPYVYVPEGLRSVNRPKLIILHDPVPRDGKRMCILIQPTGPGAAQSLEVVNLPEPLFLAYQPAR